MPPSGSRISGPSDPACGQRVAGHEHAVERTHGERAQRLGPGVHRPAEETGLLAGGHDDAAALQEIGGAGEPGWRDYWLVVDPSVNSFYANNPGSTQTPDGTHFQKAGAEAIAHLVVEEIRKHEQLHTLAKKLSR